MTSNKKGRTCFVPLCGNSTKTTPNKVFATVPRDEALRQKWLQAVRRDNLKYTSSSFSCCEDHFDLREDMENYHYYMMMGGPVKIKKGVLPHKFDCQSSADSRTCSPPQIELEGRQKRPETNTFLLEAHSSSSTDATDSLDHTATIVSSDAALSDPLKSPAGQAFAMCETVDTTSNMSPMMENNIAAQVQICQSYPGVDNSCKIPTSTVDNCYLPFQLLLFNNVAASPMANETANNSYSDPTILPNITSAPIGVTNSNDCNATTVQTSFDDPFANFQVQDAHAILNVTNYLISTNIKAYLGIPNEWRSLLRTLSKKSNISIQKIQMCLMKIRRQDTFERLAEQFCMSPSEASTIFSETVPVLSNLLKRLIFFPNSYLVKTNLPQAYESSHRNAQSVIIDTLEFQIEQPIDLVNRVLTWSEYKKCNTIKYFVACGVDGFVNYISTGFGGRTSDTSLFENCGVREKLPEKCGVMASRGFAKIEPLLAENDCVFIKPPSLSSTFKPTETELLEMQRIASLRIYRERVVERLREFDFFKPHVIINYNMLPYTDDIIVIVSALVNLQSSIIKQVG